MAQIYTHHQGAPVAVSNRGYQLVRAIAPDTTPRTPPPPNTAAVRRLGREYAKAKRKATLAERAREARNRARRFAIGE